MKPDAPNPLAELRDIHLAEPISAWPPAIGWWLLAALILISLGWLLFTRYQQHKSRAFWRAAASRLKAQQLDQELQGQTALQSCNELLKSACLLAYPNDDIAAMSGETWLDWLAQHGLQIPHRENLLSQWYRASIEPKYVTEFQLQSLVWLEQQCKDWRRV